MTHITSLVVKQECITNVVLSQTQSQICCLYRLAIFNKIEVNCSAKDFKTEIEKRRTLFKVIGSSLHLQIYFLQTKVFCFTLIKGNHEFARIGLQKAILIDKLCFIFI